MQLCWQNVAAVRCSSKSYEPISTLLYFRSWSNSGFCPVRDFVRLGFRPFLDFAHSGFCPIWDFFRFRILYKFHLVHAEDSVVLKNNILLKETFADFSLESNPG